MQKIYSSSQGAINDICWSKNSSDFVVSEIPLYEFSGNGEHLVLCVRKKELTTWKMLEILSQHSDIKTREFGYAGLKDKDGMTTQFISVNKKFEPNLENFSHPNIKIISKTYHDNKIKIGHLKQNRFFIRLKKVNPTNASKITQSLERVKTQGFANYFGYQRFGSDGTNFNDGLAILKGEKKIKNKKIKDFLISAFQSELFNSWLVSRIKLSKFADEFTSKEFAQIYNISQSEAKSIQNQPHFFKLLNGDVAHHYPYGKAFLCESLEAEAQRFYEKQIVPTGFLIGSKAIKTENFAKNIEDEIYKDALMYQDKMNGSRRFAWSFAEDVEYEYIPQNAHFEMHFSLQKGSYATVVLEEILCADLSNLA